MLRLTQWLCAVFFATCCGGWAHAGSIRVALVDSSGSPVANAVIALYPLDRPSPPIAAGTTAVMDQRGLEFVPRVLPVRVGTSVEFPNSDQTRHHVYSFSAAKTFELRLYKARPAQPVIFDKTGVVTLGCNIHDWMLGYIYVVDTPYFARSAPDGIAEVRDLPGGPYRLEIWHPRLRDAAGVVTESVRVGKDAVTRTAALALKAPIPDPGPPSELLQKFRKYQKHDAAH